ncbi:MAG: bifunctional serine/threonine-protein kinase/formylglycine-generating enzyme family protein, partial [Planctomycetota bacterium]|nr:bifunctional serine/threonine-protein kinase/formylglycine-generating enzyme family protein [Planctomycetota bacterium]
MPLADVLVQQGVITAKIRENIEKKLEAHQAGGLTKLGPYKLIKKLGEGGMGVVYLAEDTSLSRMVAVKVLPKRFSGEKEFLSRFRREAQATGKLSHPNIVSAYAVGEELGFNYYAMEYCEGEPLDSLLERENVLPWDRAIPIVIQVARGLQHAHQHGVIHRDIKPGNIFITKDGVAKILDLGLSKNLMDSERSFSTATGAALGTPHYISPEQAQGDKKKIDGRTDIYSLGTALYRMVTGQVPFQADTPMAVMVKHINEQLPNPQDINEDIPDGVVHIIQRMMAKDPADRYADCGELIADLELILEGKMPSSKAVISDKSSVAGRMKPRRIPLSPARERGGGKGVGPTAQIRLRTGGRLSRVELVPSGNHDATLTMKPKRKPLYIASGIAAVGLLVLVLVLVLGGKSKSGNVKPEGDGKGEAAKTETGTKPTQPGATVASPETINRKPETTKPQPKPAVLTPAQPPTTDIAAYAKQHGLEPGISLDLGGVKMEFVLVPAAEFMMGSEDGFPEEKPVHKVNISKPFYMGKYHVTVAQFRAFADAMKFQTEAEKAGNKGYTWDNGWKELGGVNWMKPNFPQEDNHPVCLVTWN